MNYHHLLVVILFIAGCKSANVAPTPVAPASDLTTTYFGTYTRPEGHVNGQAEGIYRAQIDPQTGAISGLETVAAVINPSFLKLTQDKKVLLAVSELAHEDEPNGFIHSFRVNGKELVEVSKLSTHGQAPCHIEVDKTGTFAIVSNYVGGTVAVYRIMTDGTLVEASRYTIAEDIKDGKPSWMHSANFSPDNEIVAIADKGMDRIWLFKLDPETGELNHHPKLWVLFEEGDGPRHTSWSADGRFLYVINELSNTVKVIFYDRAEDTFSIIQTISTLPDGYTETSYCADLHLHPNGKFLYGSNRGHNSIAMFAVNASTGKLFSLGQESTRGEYPRNFAIDKQGDFLFAANQNTNNVTVYTIRGDGMLVYSEQNFEVKTPVCIEW